MTRRILYLNSAWILAMTCLLAGCSGDDKKVASASTGESVRADDLRFWNALRKLNEWMAGAALEGKPPSIAEVRNQLAALPIQGVEDETLLAIHTGYLRFLSEAEPFTTLKPDDPDFAEKRKKADELYSEFQAHLAKLEATAEKRYANK